MEFHQDHHYVPCLYLKRFQADPGYVFTYRILVAHPDIPAWRRHSIKGVAYHKHLYTRIVSGVESDEIETWLDREFEAPAEEALNKATAGLRLAETDWYNLVRFLAAQDVRTPARLMESMSRWNETVPAVLEECLQGAIRKLEVARKSGEPVPQAKFPNSELLPVRVKTEIKPGQKFGTAKAETVVGRAVWLFSVRHTLESTSKHLHQHRWSILRPPEGMTWFTSDDPVVKLNYYPNGKYDFKGGWGSQGTEIFLPLSPHHLLYTQVGHRPPQRGTVMPLAQAELVRRLIAEHAHRIIISDSADADVPNFRHRIEDAKILREEEEGWRKWNEEQTSAERELMGWSGS